MRRLSVTLFVLLALAASSCAGQPEVEVLRDRWGIPHVYAQSEADGFYGVGYATAEDRLLQMELLRRRANGRLAEVFGPEWVASDRRFRVAGVAKHCAEAFADLPREMRGYLRAYAAGVNAWARQNPDAVRRRFAPLGISPELWTPADCLAAWMAVTELFGPLMDEGSALAYHELRALAAQVGEEQALRQRGMVIDDAAAVVPESEMAKDRKAYARLKAREPIPGFVRKGASDETIRLSHAWAVGGKRSVTGKPILESDPQTPVNNPPLWYEFHLSAGRYDTRGLGVAGCPAFLIGWNRKVAWGVTALGAGSNVTFLEKLSPDGKGYLYRDKVLPFERRYERIEVKGSAPVLQEVLTSRHGFVFNSVARQTRPGEAMVSYFLPAQDRATSVEAMLLWMRARDWDEFRRAMERYYTPGLHLVYADVEGSIGYHTLVRRPLTRRSPRIALEGWTGEDEVRGRIPLDELPHMLNPDSGVISHANNLPAGSWYPHDLGIGSGGVGDSARSMRLRQLLSGDRRFSVDSFEKEVHRDDVHAIVSALLPAAREVAKADAPDDAVIQRVLRALEGWDGRYRASDPAYPVARALSASLVPTYRRSSLRDVVGGGEGGIAHLGRLVSERYQKDGSLPESPEARGYLLAWLRAAAQPRGGGAARGGRAPAPTRPGARPAQTRSAPSRDAAQQPPPARPRAARALERHPMPYQVNGPLRFPSLGPRGDLVSPPLSCGEVGTIWSQPGNSYTQIVDLADLDNSRSLLPPGISEDPESPFHADQMEIWAAGSTHPAPLTRAAVEAVTSSRLRLTPSGYTGPDSTWRARVRRAPGEGDRVVQALPAAGAAEARPQAPPQRGRSGDARGGEAPGRR